MEKILVFGHKNPDTDAICSSLVMADLQTKIRGEEVISCRLGNLNEETKYALNYFKVKEPKLIEKVDEGQRVILVDHNEFTQSVEGIEKAKIEAVVDHHRINNFKTSEPLFYYAQPVGCTSTVLFELYNTNNIKIEPQIAGLMLSAIISDTLLLKSPTTTDKDKKAVAELVNIAGVDLSKYGLDMLKAGTNLDKYTEKELINLDAKTMEKEDVNDIINNKIYCIIISFLVFIIIKETNVIITIIVFVFSGNICIVLFHNSSIYSNTVCPLSVTASISTKCIILS